MERREFLRLSPARSTPTDGYWLHISRPAMACRFEVTLPMRDRRGVVVSQKGLEEADRLEEQLSIFRKTSEVSHVNREAANWPVRVTDSLMSLLQLCLDLHRETEGAFDITSGPLSRCWGFVRRQGRIPELEELASAQSSVGSEKIILDPTLNTVHFTTPGVEINLGSIGKGYALDRIGSLIEGRVQTALLSAGSSSMLAIGAGKREHGGWNTGIRHPGDTTRRLARLRLRDAALATSGSEEQFFEHEGRRYGHIIDPRTGQPSEVVSGVSVIAQSAAMADALATAFYVGGRDLAERYCGTHNDVMAVMLEHGSEEPIVLGQSDRCEVEIVNE